MKTGQRSSHKGFTLIEVMIALAIFAIAGTALMSSLTASVSTQIRLEERTFGQWVVENEYHQLLLSEEPIAVGESRNDVQLANIDWRVTRKISQTSEATIFKVEYEVAKVPDQGQPTRSVASLTTFIGQGL